MNGFDISKIDFNPKFFPSSFAKNVEVVRNKEDYLKSCNANWKSIIATNMLESKPNHLIPTRAKVYVAVQQGVDFIMLPRETTHGKFPLKVVSVIYIVSLRTKSNPIYTFPPTRKPVTEHHLGEIYGYHAETIAYCFSCVLWAFKAKNLLPYTCICRLVKGVVNISVLQPSVRVFTQPLTCCDCIVSGISSGLAYCICYWPKALAVFIVLLANYMARDSEILVRKGWFNDHYLKIYSTNTSMDLVYPDLKKWGVGDEIIDFKILIEQVDRNKVWDVGLIFPASSLLHCKSGFALVDGIMEDEPGNQLKINKWVVRDQNLTLKWMRWTGGVWF